MSMVQAVVSYPSTLPALVAEDPTPGSGGGAAFANTLTNARPAPPRPREAESSAGGPAALAEATDQTATKEPQDPETEHQVTPPLSPADTPEEGSVRESDRLVEEDVGDQALPTHLMLAMQHPLPVAQARSVTDQPPESATLNGRSGITLPDARSGAVPPHVAGEPGAPDTASALVADDPMVVSAAQLPFVGIGQVADIGPREPGPSDPIPALSGVTTKLSPSAGEMRVPVGFGLGPTAARLPERAIPSDPSNDAADAPPDDPDLPSAIVRLPVASPARSPDPVLQLTGLSDDPLGETSPAEHALADGIEALPLGIGGSSSATAIAPSAPAPAPIVATPALLAPIVAAAVRQNGASDITVTLSPNELGTLQMRVSMDGDTLRVTLLAERPETLDLLRRHGDQLLADLKNMGFGGASLGFGSSLGGSTAQRFLDNPPAGDAVPPSVAPPTSAPAPSRAHRAGGLDIRL